MYVPLHVGVFFLPLFFLKAAFACIDGTCSKFILHFSLLEKLRHKIFGPVTFGHLPIIETIHEYITVEL